MKVHLALALFFSSAALAEPPPVIAQWRQHHSAAAESLGVWIKTNRASARPIFHWARAHPLRAQALIKWFVDHPEQGLDEFSAAHSDWPAAELVWKPNRAAMEGLVRWVTEHVEAANDLAAVPRGLAMVGMHLYRDFWDEDPNRQP
jgi:hypothetical protein